MNVVLLAATGQAGLTILSELLHRGHQVKAVARSPQKLPRSINAVADDLSNADRLAEIIQGADAVISAFGPSKADPRYFSDEHYTDQLVEVTHREIEAVRKARVPRLIVVGGCGSLLFAPGVTVLQSGHWPERYAAIARSHVKALAALHGSGLNWTYFSPPMTIQPGVRTGVFRLGDAHLLRDPEGKSWISYEDYAIALVNELEVPQHERTRFTAGY
jgi:uncharacterized protein